MHGHRDMVLDNKMKTRKLFFIFAILLLGILLAPNIYAQETSVCCEQADNGAYCVSVPLDQCTGSGVKKAPTSCEFTSFCKLGTCVNTRAGICMENTPKITCDENNGGVWVEGKPEDIPQCQLGCCLIGDQAAFVTKNRCKSLSSDYGLEINYRADIRNEVECIALARPDVKGACVFEKDFDTTCRFGTKKECQDIEAGAGEGGAEFYESLLCTNFNLSTNCAPTQKTTCVDERDEVFFLDSCGNLANIYDKDEYESQEYWDRVYSKNEICGRGSSNADDSSCGNCDYFEGSTCGKFRRGVDQRPNMGENICRDLGCQDYVNRDGFTSTDYPQHGESWCATSEGISNIIAYQREDTDSQEENLPGSEYTRLTCYNGEILVEPCASWRSEVCIQDDINGFKTSGCRVNRWQDCVVQPTEFDCLNTDQRDCKWINTNWNFSENDLPGIIVNDTLTNTPNWQVGACVPKYSPGIDYWKDTSDAEDICSLADAICIIKKYEAFFVGEIENETENAYCLEKAWEDDLKNICSALGDCGSTINYIGTDSYKDWDKAFVRNESDY